MRKTYNKRIGDPSSEYGMPDGGQRFEEALQKKQERAEYIWGEFVEFMRSRDVKPQELRGMFIRYYEEYIEWNICCDG